MHSLPRPIRVKMEQKLLLHKEVEGDYKVFIFICKLIFFKSAGSYFRKHDELYKFTIYSHKKYKLGMTYSFLIQINSENCFI